MKLTQIGSKVIYHLREEGLSALPRRAHYLACRLRTRAERREHTAARAQADAAYPRWLAQAQPGPEERRRQGYRSLDYYQQDPVLKRVLDQISAGFSDGRAYTDLTNRLLFGGGGGIADEYMLLADFDSYCQAHRRSLEVYKDRRAWDQKSLINIARSGIFAADRSIRDYARDIWHVPTRFD